VPDEQLAERQSDIDHGDQRSAITELQPRQRRRHRGEDEEQKSGEKGKFKKSGNIEIEN
jgi:hypothetical protein